MRSNRRLTMPKHERQPEVAAGGVCHLPVKPVELQEGDSLG